ncbi:MAG: TadE family protein [Bryobacteraceae bacterium]
MRAVVSKPRQRGSLTFETALVFIPTMFLFMGLIEVSRGLWMYHTLASAVKTAARYSIVHGETCVSSTAACQITVADVARTMKQRGLGLDESSLSLSMKAGDSSVSCEPVTNCLQNGTAWPPAPYNLQGLPVQLQAQYRFGTVFWPFGNRSFTFNARAQESIQF